MKSKKVLFTTAYKNGKLYDYWEANSRAKIFRLSYTRRISFGLKFLKENIPQVEILEYPTIKEYKQKIKKNQYDIVGFSFYTNEIDEIIEMIEYAKEHGIKEIWGGNYGVLNDEIAKYFDKIFLGYVEEEVAKELRIKIDKVKHPTLIVYSGMPIGIHFAHIGQLQTSRGCTMNCEVCQTPDFCPKISTVPISSIEDVLRRYKKMGVGEIIIFDENFGLLKNHTEKVTLLLKKYGFSWNPMTRVDFLNQNLDKWMDRGLSGALIGIESISQQNLNSIKKRITIEQIEELVEKMNERNLFIIGYYMIGFEHDTPKSIKKDMKKLKKMNLDMYQVCVMTPFPKSKLYNRLSKQYGIIDHDYKHYDAKHLVWKHPTISPKEMRSLLDYCFRTLYTPKAFFKTLVKFQKKYRSRFGFFGGLGYIIKSLYQANKSFYLKKIDK
jgi:radical SAM superfamily enzyme YgiQ (UPF0313 family)